MPGDMMPGEETKDEFISWLCCWGADCPYVDPLELF